MTNWHVGQKIVCINAGKIDNVPNFYVKEFLKQGNVYIIEAIVDFQYDTLEGKEIAFKLEGIDPRLLIGKKEYFFWHGRFKPLENEDDKIDISVFKNLLNDVKDGKVFFDDNPYGSVKRFEDAPFYFEDEEVDKL